MILEEIRKELRQLADPDKAKLYQGFFKTGNGQYGEGDIFIGLTVPQTRAVAIKYSNLDIYGIQDLLNSKMHEERLMALLILTHNFQKSDEMQKYKLLSFYLKNTKQINNWDLVDLTAHKIVGSYLEDKPKDILYQLARSNSLWERRISIISTAHFIKNGQFQDTLDIAEILLFDSHDLIHKAVGWMLREVGKKDLAVEEQFLKKHYKKMPRTMLRYAIEKFPENKRQKYLKGKI